jgi:sugar lactone lactonase YvrE
LTYLDKHGGEHPLLRRELARRVVDDLQRPNGIEVWQDRLFVADTAAERVYVCRRNEDGTVRGKRLF